MASFFQDLLDTVAERGRQLIGLDRAGHDDDLAGLTAALLSGRGEASGVALARELLDAYARADANQRTAFLRTLSVSYGPDLGRLDAAVRSYREQRSALSVSALTAAADPRRREVIRRLNLAPGGTAALVSMRADLLDRLPDNPELAPLEADFKHMLSSWFNRGFLVLRHIDWTTPANILAKVIAYEAVHTIQSWDDLRGRIEPADRRCYAFFHPQLADDPLIFVEVALTRSIPAAVGPLIELDRDRLPAEQATTAVFYSISNCQRGLRGVSFGNFLIKQVVEDLKRELPRLSTFVTLSPVPGFAGWLEHELAAPLPTLISPADAGLLRAEVERGNSLSSLERGGDAEDALLTAAATYLVKAKSDRGGPLDAVARFHLGNGARLERLNPGADTSSRGLAQSYGLMVNYFYDLENIERNHEAFAERGQVVASAAVRKRVKSETAVRALLTSTKDAFSP